MKVPVFPPVYIKDFLQRKILPSACWLHPCLSPLRPQPHCSRGHRKGHPWFNQCYELSCFPDNTWQCHWGLSRENWRDGTGIYWIEAWGQPSTAIQPKVSIMSRMKRLRNSAWKLSMTFYPAGQGKIFFVFCLFGFIWLVLVMLGAEEAAFC